MFKTNRSIIKTKKEENNELFKKLTKRNEQYMMSLNKALVERNVSEAKKEEVFNDMLHN